MQHLWETAGASDKLATSGLLHTESGEFWERFLIVGMPTGWHFILLAVLIFAAYMPAVNNGFISDDFIMLNWVEQWKGDITFLFRIFPDVFRITVYVVFRSLLALFGFHSEYFYTFAILIHLLNSILLYYLAKEATGSRELAFMSGALFAVYQNPQEAIMWLAAMADALAALFVLATLLLWGKELYLWAAACYIAGLFSKESAAAVLLLLPCLELFRIRRLTWRWQYLYLLVPTAAYLLLFAVTASDNYLLINGSYRFGLRGFAVLVVSAHRVMFPWFYLALITFLIVRKGRVPAETVAGVAWLVLTILPFIFLTYQLHLPSRHQYIASIGLAWAVASLLRQLGRPALVRAFVALFIVVNITYLWLKKDPQFEKRAAPTTQLMTEVRRHPAGSIYLIDFPLNPWMARMAVTMTGSRSEDLRFNAPPEPCADCLVLQWESRTGRYRVKIAPDLAALSVGAIP